jgi:hypothetical protein
LKQKKCHEIPGENRLTTPFFLSSLRKQHLHPLFGP